MKTNKIVLGFLAILLSAGTVYSQANKLKTKKNKEMTNLKAIVLPFYQKALTVNTETNPSDVLNTILADNFVSEGTVDNKNKEQLIGQLDFFWKMIPDLVWEPQEIIESGNKVIVRSKISGTPNSPEGKFFGVPTDGTNSFQTMSIDIHAIENGKIVKVNHIEDWATAIKQVEKKDDVMSIANAFMDAMGKGDMEAMMELMHGDMVWQNAGDPNVPWIGPWKGKKTILEDFMPKFGAGFKTIKWEPNDALSNGDTAAYFGQMIGELTNSNQKTKEFTYALRVKVKDGKVILWNWFEDSYEVSRAYHSK